MQQLETVCRQEKNPCVTTSYLYRKPIGPGEECRETVTLKARRSGRQEIVANYYCRQICDVASAAELDITDDSKDSKN